MSLTILDNVKFNMKWAAGFLPFMSRYVFLDADAIFQELEASGTVDYIKDLRPAERRLLHFSLGMGIRNAFLLWHPRNPYTALAMAGLSDEKKASSPYHPDNYSWSILRRLIIKATHGSNAISTTFDAAESLLYSLLVNTDDSPETLEGIREAISELVDTQNYSLLDDVITESLLLALTPAQLQVVVKGVRPVSGRLSQIPYLRIVQKALSYGVVV